MRGGPPKGNFIHVYNPLALEPDLETECWSGSESSGSSPCSTWDLTSSPRDDPEAIPDRYVNVPNGEEVPPGSALGSQIASSSALIPTAIIALVQRWYSQLACCTTSNVVLPSTFLHIPTEQRTLLDDHELGFDDTITEREVASDSSPNAVEQNETAPVAPESSSPKCCTPKADDASQSTVDSLDVSDEALPPEVLVEVDALVRQVGDFLELRRQFADTFAGICQREECDLPMNSVAELRPLNFPTSPMSARCGMFLQLCLVSVHLDPDSLVSSDDTTSILCVSLRRMDALFAQIQQRISGWPLTLVGLENNLRPSVSTAGRAHHTGYPSLILWIQDSDKDGDTKTYRIELHHMRLYTLRQQNDALYRPFAAIASSPHASLLNRLFTVTEKRRTAICEVLNESQKDIDLIRAFRVLLALLKGEPDSGALGEWVLERLVRNVDGKVADVTAALVHNAYANMLYKKAQRQVEAARLDEAEDLFARALIELRPCESSILSPLLCDYARVREQRGHLGDAELLLRQALDLQDPAPVAAHQLALVLMQRGAFLQCDALCSEWHFSMEDIERELRLAGKLPPGKRKGTRCRCVKT